MDQYLGVKLINALPMNRLEYNRYRGWDLPSDENGQDQGYLVEYLDGGASNDSRHKGYISWSPKEVFEQAYRKTNGLSFGLALEALKRGEKVARAGWNGKGMFIFMRPEDNIDPHFIITQVKSLPDSYKNTLKNVTFQSGEKIKFTAYLCMKAADNSIVNGWLASQTDMLSDDWCIIE